MCFRIDAQRIQHIVTYTTILAHDWRKIVMWQISSKSWYSYSCEKFHKDQWTNHMSKAIASGLYYFTFSKANSTESWNKVN